MGGELLGLGLAKPLKVVEHVVAIMHEIGPTHGLRSHIEELCHNTLTIVLRAEQLNKHRHHALTIAGAVGAGHAGEHYGGQHR